jgi:2-dehydropantoate 2-reductase
MRGAICDIVAGDGGEALIRGLLDEARAIAAAAGTPLRDKAYLGTRKLLTDAASPMMASMLRDVEAGGPTEADHILGDLVERARSLGVATPLLGLAYLNLQAYAARRRREAAAGAPA